MLPLPATPGAGSSELTCSEGYEARMGLNGNEHQLRGTLG